MIFFKKNVNMVFYISYYLKFMYIYSGLYQVKWRLGTSEGLSDIGYGALAVRKMAENV